MKLMIWIGMTVGGVIGSYLGSFLDHGNLLGAWGLIIGTVGSLVGVWAGYKIGNRYF